MKSLSNTVIAAIIAVVLAALIGLLLLLPIGREIEAWTGDKMMTWRYDLLKKIGSERKPDPHIVLVSIDQKSVSDLGRWPFPRNIHGQFLGVLAPQKPKVVAWDIFFTERTTPNLTEPVPAPNPPASPTPPTPTTGVPSAPPDTSSSAPPSPPAPDAPPSPAPNAPPQVQPDDAALVEGAKLIPQMVTVSARESVGSTLKDDSESLPTRPLKNIQGDRSSLISYPYAIIPFPELRKVSYFGFADADANDLRRLIPLIIDINDKVFPSWDLQVLMQYWDVDPDKVVVTLGHDISLPRPDGTVAHLPINAAGEFLVNYRGRTEDFSNDSYSTMGQGLADIANNQMTKERAELPPLKDNIVVVGVNLSGTDNGPIPIDKYSPLVVAHLNVLNNVLQEDYLHVLSPWIWLPIYTIFLFVAGNLMLRVGIAPMIPIGLVAMLLLGLVAFAALFFGNWQVPVAGPEFGLLVLASVIPTKRFFGEEREKLRVKRAMSSYLSEKVMNKVLEHPDNIKLGGVKQVITVMFCDIRGFTAYCDNRDSEEVLTVLNEYMEVMTQVVFKYDGTVDKYIGDCIMAFWNAPQEQADHAQRAVCCAMEMRYALANFKTKRAGKDTELFECGIGIHTGEALVGNMGSTLKLNYTAMGSNVNLGARLESLTKRLNERILISQATLDLLQGDFPITDRGEAAIPGFANPVHVYAVGADQDIRSALKIGRTIAAQQEYTAEEVSAPIWEPAPLPEDADPNP